MDDFPPFRWSDAKADINLMVHRVPFASAAAALRDPGRLLVARAGAERPAAAVVLLDGRALTVALLNLGAAGLRLVSARCATPLEWRAVARPDGGSEPGRHVPTLSPADTLRLDGLSAAEIRRNAEADPDNPPLAAPELAQAEKARRVRASRTATGLDRPSFARRYRLDPDRLADWEWGLALPDATSLAYLTVIAREPDAVDRALAGHHPSG